ncbi:hypothetical protein HF292_009765 [Acidithiobacillus ferruginosus]|jgi:hypothetical protein|uniref:Uncharacterized protein n=1 Tax=Acidithiobacillus ferruginosus TaxID=3063951 RepID=A0ACD5IH99_9PROT|nr:hypothetical protein [Acidithiobacillus ferruginosus]MBU2815088.1 hypothetical protein [Acidithiobacillus ferruginosus]
MSDIDALAGLNELLNIADKPQAAKKARPPSDSAGSKVRPARTADVEPAQTEVRAQKAASEADSTQPLPDLAIIMDRLNGIDARVEDIYREVQLLQGGDAEEDPDESPPSPVAAHELATEPTPQQPLIQLSKINEEVLLEAAVGKLFQTSMRLRLSFAMLVGAFLAVIAFALGMGYGVIIESGKYPFWYVQGAEKGFAAALITTIAAPAGVLLLPVIAGALWLAAREFRAEGHMQYGNYCRWASLAVLLLAVAAPFLV